MKKAHRITTVGVLTVAIATLASDNCPFVVDGPPNCIPCAPEVPCDPPPGSEGNICVGWDTGADHEDVILDPDEGEEPAPYKVTPDAALTRTIRCWRFAGECDSSGVCNPSPEVPPVNCKTYEVPILNYPSCPDYP
jgi:hypothetical protein